MELAVAVVATGTDSVAGTVTVAGTAAERRVRYAVNPSANGDPNCVRIYSRSDLLRWTGAGAGMPGSRGGWALLDAGPGEKC